MSSSPSTSSVPSTSTAAEVEATTAATTTSTATSLLRITGVPEHFNRPWESAVSNGHAAREAGVERVEWVAEPAGTGAMMSALRSGKVDVAVALTEGAVAACAAHLPGEEALVVCGEYVRSPLRWMVCTSSTADAALDSLERVPDVISCWRRRCCEDNNTGVGANQAYSSSLLPSLQSLSSLATESSSSSSMLAASSSSLLPPRRLLRVAVSRLGSGSHLMAYLLAQREGWPIEHLEFVVLHTFAAMRCAVRSGEADICMWEWHMTSPFVHNGELRTLGFIDTPWPAFSLVCRRRWWEERKAANVFAQDADEAAPPCLRRLVEVAVSRECERFCSDADGASCRDICETFGLRADDALAWLRSVEYAPTLRVRRTVIDQVLRSLESVRVLSPLSETTAEDVVADGALVSVDESVRQSSSAVPPPDKHCKLRNLAGLTTTTSSSSSSSVPAPSLVVPPVQ